MLCGRAHAAHLLRLEDRIHSTGMTLQRLRAGTTQRRLRMIGNLFRWRRGFAPRGVHDRISSFRRLHGVPARRSGGGLTI
jgi:hypothetical protein